MTTIPDKEPEAFGLIIARQKSGASENDIRAAFQHFAATAANSKVARNIEKGVAQLLSDPAQAALAEQQIAATKTSASGS